jgi:hypothetical protein
LDERGKLVVRVQAARTGQHPDVGTFEHLRLEAERRLPATERHPVGAEADEGDRARAMAAYLAGELPSAANELCGRQLVGSGRAAVHEIGQAAAQAEQARAFRGLELPRREPGSA